MNLPFIRINLLGMLVLSVFVLFCIYLYASSWNDNKSEENTLISLKHLLAVSVSAAELGGLKVKEVHQSSDLKKKSKGKTREGANDPMTYGDLLSHRTMLYSLKKSFPNLKIVSEEHDENKIEPHDIGPPVSTWISVDNFGTDILVPMKDILVWIDPLDATQEYTENLLDYVTTMVCVAVKGKPVLGVIHRPFQNVTVWGWDGKGISNPKLIQSAKVPNQDRRVITVSRSHSGKVKEVARAAFGPEAEVVSAGGSGYKTLQVAEGKADAYIHVTLIKKWDICAGNALLSSLGGKMTALDGTSIDYGSPFDVKNEKGLVATLHNHEEYVNKLSSLSS